MSQLTPTEALRRVKLGCSVLCVGVPQGTTFGVDATLWTVAGAAHTGVKMVPAGLHLLVHSVGHGFHAGQFVELTPSTVLVRSWDPALEDFRADGFASSGMSEAEHARYVHGVRNFDFDRQLGAYSDENANAWLRLASCINVAVLAQCGLRLTFQRLQKTATFDRVWNRNVGRSKRRRKNVHRHRSQVTD